MNRKSDNISHPWKGSIILLTSWTPGHRVQGKINVIIIENFSFIQINSRNTIMKYKYLYTYNPLFFICFHVPLEVQSKRCIITIWNKIYKYALYSYSSNIYCLWVCTKLFMLIIQGQLQYCGFKSWPAWLDNWIQTFGPFPHLLLLAFLILFIWGKTDAKVIFKFLLD